MFIVLLKFAQNRANAGHYMQAHKDWITRGREAGIFLLVGSLKPAQGGMLLAHNTSLEALKQRVAEDPFMQHQVVSSEIIEVAPNQADQRLAFLLN